MSFEDSKGGNLKLIALGQVCRPFGITGEIRIRSYNPDVTLFLGLEGLWLKKENSESRYYELISVRPHKNDEIRIKLKGIRTRDEAESLRGAQALVLKSQLPQTEEGEFYWHQLIGLEVFQGEEKIGFLSRIEVTAPELDGNDIFVVESERGEFLIPATEEAIEKIDLEKRRMDIAESFKTNRS